LLLGLEGVIFVGGVSLGQPGTSIPIAVIVGILCGFLIGVLIYQFANRTSKSLNSKSTSSISPLQKNSHVNFPCDNGEPPPPYWRGVIHQVRRCIRTPQVQPPPWR
jgi:hypothetical protein